VEEIELKHSFFCVNSNKRRKSDEWVLLKRCRIDSTQTSMLIIQFKIKTNRFILVPPVQSILPNTSTTTTTIDESAATPDVKLSN